MSKKLVVACYKTLSEQMTMPSGSPTSDKYVVYTVDTDDSSSGLEDGHIVFRDPDGVSLHEKNGMRHQPLHSPSTDSWGSYWSKREKCCCLWNLFLIVIVVSLASVFIVLHRNLTTNDHVTENSSFINTLSSVSPVLPTKYAVSTPADDKPQMCTSHDCVQLAGSILSRMNPDVDPCEDFYAYSCGGFQKQTYLTWQKPRIRENPELLLENYEEFLKDKLSSPNDAVSISTENQLKVVYQSCLKRENISTKTLKEKFRDLVLSLNASDTEDNVLGFTKLVAMVTRDFGASPFFKVVVDQKRQISLINKYSDAVIKDLSDVGIQVYNYRFLMPSDLYYRDPYMDPVMTEYRTYVGSLLLSILGGEDGEQALYQDLVGSLEDIFNLEIKLNQKYYNEETRSVLDLMQECSTRSNMSMVQKLFPGYNISWEDFINILLKGNESIASGVTDFCLVELSSSVQTVIKNTDYRTLKKYVIIHTLLFTDVYLLFSDRTTTSFDSKTNIYRYFKDIEDESFCVSLLSSLLPLSSLIDIPNKLIFQSEAVMIFDTLKSKLMELINDLYWIPADQRKALLDHIDMVILTFEWNQWDNSSIHEALNILETKSDDFITVFLHFIKFKSHAEICGKRINSYNTRNVCTFDKRNLSLGLSAAAIHDPTFYHPATVPVTYGSLGSVVAQAIVTAFDIDALLQHFMSGMIDRRVIYTLAHHLQCLIDTFNQYFLTDTQGNSHQVRGDLTKGENFKDSLALHVAYRAYKTSYNRGYHILRLPALNMTDDRVFFLTFAQLSGYCIACLSNLESYADWNFLYSWIIKVRQVEGPYVRRSIVEEPRPITLDNTVEVYQASCECWEHFQIFRIFLRRFNVHRIAR